LPQDGDVGVSDLYWFGENIGNADWNTNFRQFQSVVAGDDTASGLVDPFAHAVTPHSTLLALDSTRKGRVLPAIDRPPLHPHLVIVQVTGNSMLHSLKPLVHHVWRQHFVNGLVEGNVFPHNVQESVRQIVFTTGTTSNRQRWSDLYWWYRQYGQHEPLRRGWKFGGGVDLFVPHHTEQFLVPGDFIFVFTGASTGTFGAFSQGCYQLVHKGDVDDRDLEHNVTPMPWTRVSVVPAKPTSTGIDASEPTVPQSVWHGHTRLHAFALGHFHYRRSKNALHRPNGK